MDPTIVGALIGVGGGILAALLGRVPIENLFSSWGRRQNNIPEIMNTRWAAQWCYEDGSLFVSDNVTFEKWRRGNRFTGYGEVTHDSKEYRYSIEGEVSPKGLVVLTYKAQKYPSQASIGMACVELSLNAERLEGTWAGLASKTLPDGQVVPAIRSGPVKMAMIRNLKT